MVLDGNPVLYRISLYMAYAAIVMLLLNLVLAACFNVVITFLLHLPYLLIIFIALLDAAYSWGLKRALAFFTSAFIIGLLSEIIGVLYGVPFGRYHYTVEVGKIFGIVPFDIPIYWFVITYVSFSMNNKIFQVDHKERNYTYAVPLISLLDGFCATAWDLIMDPVMVNILNVWVWEEGGEFFNIPMSNFLGWILVAALISLTYRIIVIKTARSSMVSYTNVSAIVYFELWLTMVIIAYHANHLEYLPIGTMMMFTFLIILIIKSLTK